MTEEFSKLNILPMSLYEFTLPLNLFKKTEKLIKEIETQDYRLREHKDHFGESTLGINSLHKHKKFKQLTDYIDSCLETIKQDQQLHAVEKLKVCLLWANKSKTYKWHHAHLHPWSILSGIIYIQGTSGNTWFSREDDYAKLCSWSLRSDENEKNHMIYKHKPQVGKMIIFPSYLIHSVDENFDAEDRITISFNSFASGVVGNLDGLAGLNININ